MHGFSIAQITDVHVGPTIKRGFVERIVERVNDLNADLIAVTGDLVDGSVQQLSAHTAPLAKLSARHGAYFVTGNHEYYSGERAWTRELGRLGLTVLKNEHVVLRHDGALLVLAGVNDFGAHHFDPAQRSDPAAALHGAPQNAGARILLAHQPRSAPDASDAGFDLQISGHTHGGQFWPWNFFVRYFQPFTAGLHRLKNLWVYVSRGTGYWGPPNRFGVPSEITQITIGARAGVDSLLHGHSSAALAPRRACGASNARLPRPAGARACAARPIGAHRCPERTCRARATFSKCRFCPYTSLRSVKNGAGKTIPFFNEQMAERVGFEPTCRNYPTIRFRVGAVMTTSVPLR